MSTDDKFALTILNKKANHLGVDLIQLARAVSDLDDRTLIQSIVNDIQSRKRFPETNQPKV